MRRSAAPSQTGAGGIAKRHKFVSPALTGNYITAQTSYRTPTVLHGHSIDVTAINKSGQSREIDGLIQIPTSVGSSKQSTINLFKHVIRSDSGRGTEISEMNVLNHNDRELSVSLSGRICKSDTSYVALESEQQHPRSKDQQVSIKNVSRPQEDTDGSSTISMMVNKSLEEKPSTFGTKNTDLFSVMSPSSGPTVIDKATTESISMQNASVLMLDSHQQGENQFRDTSNTSSSALYLSVVWCKMSKKKHKKWEGDAILTTSGRTVTLYDMDGKIIGKGCGYKTSDLESLKEDETLFVGGKEIQIMSVLTEEYFKSGRCFTSANEFAPSADNDRNEIKRAGVSKPFMNPALKAGHANMMKKEAVDKPQAAPKYDPNSPNALVMSRPSTDHQWKHNRQGLPVVDVVVDPYLTNHLRSHQRAGVIFLYECIMGMRDYQGLGAILADDMGLGKTLQCICLIWTLLKQGPYGGSPVVRRVLIVTPGSLVKNWFLEFKKWLGTERLNVFAVSADKRADEFVKSNLHPVMVISYEMFVRCYELIMEVSFDLIICDEGHRLKNTAIKTTNLIMSLSCRRRIVLTGTPVQNDLQEFYSIVEFCNPGVLGSSAAFRHIYEDPVVASRQPKATNVQQELGAERAQELTRLTQMFVLRRTQEINNDYLPPKVEMVLFCKPSPLQLTLYRQLIHSNMIRRCLAGNLSGSPHLICIGALKQLCNHPGLIYRKAAEEKLQMEKDHAFSVSSGNGGNSTKDWEDSIYSGLLSYFPETFDAGLVSSEDSGKLMVLSGILSAIWGNSAFDKVVLVSNHTKTLDFLEVFCKRQGYVFLRLDGQTPTAQRQDIVCRFNNKSSPFRIFLLSSKAGGVGLNLVGASRLILYDIDWNPANDLQAMARVWRDGQKGKVYIYRLLTVGTIEEKMYQRQITKQGLSGAVMDLSSRKNNVHFSLEDLKDLFSLNEVTDCETHSMLACSCWGDPSYAQEETEASNNVEERQCQLGRPCSTSLKNKASNLTMAELSHWKHWRGEFVAGQKNWCLDQAGPSLSFVFWNESNAE